MTGALRALWADEDGVTTVEYALLLGVVVVGSIGAWSVLAERVGAAVTAAESAVAGD